MLPENDLDLVVETVRAVLSETKMGRWTLEESARK